MHVLLDLWGVLLDMGAARLGYRDRVASIFQERFGKDRDRWLRAHDVAWEAYLQRTREVGWDAGPWAEIVARLDAEWVTRILEEGGEAWRPEDPVAWARELDFEVLSSINARFPDARSAVERLRASGHRIHVATQGTESSARGALVGAGLVGSFERLFTGDSQDALKSDPRYWSTIPGTLDAPPTECIVVDDCLDYLGAASSVGFLALLVDRTGSHAQEEVPLHVRATLRNLAGLSHFLDRLADGSL